MADQQEPQIVFPKFQEYLNKMVYVNESSNPTSRAIRTLIKWLFELLRNLMIVGVLLFLAKKTDNLILEWVGKLSVALLLGYLWTYIDPILLRPFHGLKNKRLAFWLDTILHLLIIGAIWFATVVFLTLFTNEIAQSYVK